MNKKTYNVPFVKVIVTKKNVISTSIEEEEITSMSFHKQVYSDEEL